MPDSETQSKPRLLRDIVAVIAGRQRDYTSGPLGRAILLLAIPMVLEMSMQAIFGIVDVFFVGKLGTAPVAIVILTDQLLMVVFATAIGFSMGTTALVARRIGEGRPEVASRTALQAIYVGIAFSIPLAIVGITAPRWLLAQMGASEAVLDAGAIYTAIMFGGNITIFLLFLINAIFRGAGDPAYAMRSLWLANLLNIALDPLLIFGWGPVPAMGLKGAAIATTIGRTAGVLYQLWILSGGQSRIHIRVETLRIDFGLMRRLIRISAIGVLQFSVSTLSFMVIARMMARFGDVALAGYGIAIRLISFVLLPAWGVGNAAATLVGQNLGAGNPERAERSVWVTGFVNMCFLGTVAVVFIFGAEPIAALFHSDPEVVALAGQCLRVVSFSYVFWAYGMTTVMAFNGAGDTTTPTWINFFVFWVVQIPLAWALAIYAGYGPVGLFAAVAISQATLAVVGVSVFRRGRWKTRAI